MSPIQRRGRPHFARYGAIVLAAGLALLAASCTTVPVPSDGERLRETVNLIEDVKEFGKTIGIEPTDALRRSAGRGPTLSMLWLWMQRAGTIATRAPVDIRLAIGFNAEREAPNLEQVYRVDGYSVYYRQGSEFADPRSVATAGFAEAPLVRRVKVILHEDLHGDANFALPWEIEEALVTPLGSLAAVEYFRRKGDEKNLGDALQALAQERQMARELLALVAQAEKIFALGAVDEAKQKVLDSLGQFPAYRRQFERQTSGQHPATVLEAKLSHDLAYYRYFDAVAALAERTPRLKTLIDDLKRLPKDATPGQTEAYLRQLSSRYRLGAS